MKEKISSIRRSISLKVQTSKPVSLLNQARRRSKNLRSGRKSGKKYVSEFKYPNPLEVGGRVFRIITSRLGLFVYALLLSFVFLFLFAKYFSFQPYPSTLDWEPSAASLVGGDINVMLLAYESQDQYAFVDFIAVLSISRSEEGHKLIVVNPDFGARTLGEQLKIRNLLSNSVIKGVSPMGTLLKGVEGLLGLKIDRYLSVESKKVPEIMSQYGLTIEAYDSVIDVDAGVFTQGQRLEGESLFRYLAAEGERKYEQRMRRQSLFMRELVSKRLNFSALPNLILSSEVILENIETNMSREELLGMTMLMVTNSKIETSYLKTTDSFYIADSFGGLYEANLGAVDRQVQGLFARVDVLKEQARIEIYNATKTSGLASRHKRLIENFGGNVIRAANSPDFDGRTKLYVKNPDLYPKNIELIRQVLADRVIVIKDSYPLQHAGELVLILGEDLIETLPD